jgi:hypothetical protein
MSTETHSTETTETTVTTGPKRSAAANTLIVVGFLLLIFLGIAVAIYSSRYVPMAVNTFSTSNPVTGLPNTSSAQLAVEPGQSIPFNDQQIATTSTVMVPAQGMTDGASTDVPSSATPAPSYAATASAYPAVAPQSTYASQPYGLPNLTTHIVAVGYAANSSNSSFVATPVVPVGARAAVQFTIGNTGTAPTGPWAFIAQIPTDNGYTFDSPVEASMNPGDHVLFTLVFDQVPEGPAEMINIIADPNNYIQETTKSDNVSSGSVSVVGS